MTTVLGETRTRESAVLIGTITKQTNLDTTTTTTFFPLLRCRGTTSAELAALSAGASFAASGQTLPPPEEPPQTGANWFSGQESSIRLNEKPTEMRRNSDQEAGQAWRGKLVGRQCISAKVNSPKRTNVAPVTCGRGRNTRRQGSSELERGGWVVVPGLWMERTDWKLYLLAG